MDLRAILVAIAIGAVAGWLASIVMGGGGLIRYIVTGLIGAFVGSAPDRLIASRWHLRARGAISGR